jgi:putative ABC transport system permease protein
MGIRTHWDILAQDIHYGVRTLLRTPSFTLAAVAAMTLGIGAGTAVFSVVDRILFRALPYPNDGRLLSLGMTAPIAPQEFLLGYDYLDWRAASIPFESIGAWSGVSDCDLTDSNPARLQCGIVDSHLLPTLGIQPVLGRNFTAMEDQPRVPKVALISYGLWRSRFGGDTALVGKTIPLDGQPVTISGVLPPQFELPSLAHIDLLVPQALDLPETVARRNATILYTVGRLKAGASIEQARAALAPLFAHSMKDVPPNFRKDVKLYLRPLRDLQTHDSRLASWILLAAVLAVLLIACANVANLLLARAAGRRREMAVRAALGASRGRLVRAALSESLLLAAAGGVGGCTLAVFLLRWFVGIAPDGIPRLHQAALDTRVLLFSLAISLAAGLLFGLAPALSTPRGETLAGWRTVGARSHFFRQSLVAAQIAISVVLLAGAGLLLRSLWNLESQPLGMRTSGVLTATIALGPQAYPDQTRRTAFFDEWEEKLRHTPGVSDAALVNALPPLTNVTLSMLYNAIGVQGRPQDVNGTGGRVAWRAITPDYFAVLGIPIERGRAFREEDRGADQNVVILNNALAHRMFPHEDPIGKQIQPGRRGPWLNVIGVAGNVKNSGLVDDAGPEYYVARKHSGENVGRTATAIVRTTADFAGMARWLRAEVSAIDPTAPVTIETMQQHVGKLAERPRFNALLLGLFAATGLLLATIGLYGVVSFLVAQRTPEIGVRMALGATPSAISGLVFRHAARSAAAGAVAGSIASYFLVQLLSTMLFQVPAHDPWTVGAVLALLTAVVMLASWIPSRRAARLNPVEVLRQE